MGYFGLTSIRTDRPEAGLALKVFAGLNPGVQITASPAATKGRAARAGNGILAARSIFFTFRWP